MPYLTGQTETQTPATGSMYSTSLAPYGQWGGFSALNSCGGTPADYASADIENNLWNTDPFIASGFSFGLPTGAIIDGIEVSISRYASEVSYVYDGQVQLYIDGALRGDDKKSSSFWPTSNTAAGYGGPADTWNINSNFLTPDNINSTNFGIVVSAAADQSHYGGWVTSDVNVDCIQITMNYHVRYLCIYDTNNTLCSGVYYGNTEVTGVYYGSTRIF